MSDSSFSFCTPEWEILLNTTNHRKIKPEKNPDLPELDESIDDTVIRLRNSVNKIQKIPVIREITEITNHKNHPRFAWLQSWLEMNEENQVWYNENAKKNFDLVDGGIMMLWDVFELQAETATHNNIDIWNYQWDTLFNYDAAKRHVEENGKRMVEDWEKYTSFLPWDDQNKSEFLQKVLWLTFNGYCYWNFSSMSNKHFAGYYWSNNSILHDSGYLKLNRWDIYIGKISKDFGFCLICLKK